MKNKKVRKTTIWILSMRAFFVANLPLQYILLLSFIWKGRLFYCEVTGTFYIDECNCRQQVTTGISNKVTRDRFIVWLYCLLNKRLFQLMS